MARAATAPELAYLRSSPQASSLRIAIINPVVTFAARVNQTFTSSDCIAQVTFDGVTTGAYTDLIPGQTLWIGSAAGLCDIGQARIRKAATSTVIYIGETSEIAWADNLYLTCSPDYALWAKSLRIVSAVPYMDYDIAYSDQNSSWSPIPIMGPHCVAKLTGSTVATAWSAAGSWCPGSTISGYAWTAPGASATSGLTTATPTITYNAAGTYLVSLTVTAANGKTAIGWRYAVVRPATEAASNVILNSASGSWSQGGWELSVRMYSGADSSLVRDRALCILYSDDWYGSTQVSIGPVVGRETIIACGWINGANITRDPNGGYVEFDIAGPHYWLGIGTSFPLGLQNITGTPAAWTDVAALTIDKCLAHYATWRSTLAAVCDVYPSGDTRVAPALITSAASLWSQLQTMLERTILARPTCDRYGRLYAEIDTQMTPLASRSAIPTVMTITTTDTEKSVEIEYSQAPKTSRLELSGVSVASGTTTASSIFSLSPGHVFKHWGAPEVMDRLLLTSQVQANSLAGLILGYKNNRMPRITIPLRSNNKLIDIAPRQYVTLPLTAGQTPSGLAFAGNVLPREIKLEHRAGALLTEIVGEAETFEDISLDGDAPPSGVTIYPPLPPVQGPPRIPPFPKIRIPAVPKPPNNPLVINPLGIVSILIGGKGIWTLDPVHYPEAWVNSTSYGWSSAELAEVTNFELDCMGTAALLGTYTIWTQSVVDPFAARSEIMNSTILSSNFSFDQYFGLHIGVDKKVPGRFSAWAGGRQGDARMMSTYLVPSAGTSMGMTWAETPWSTELINFGGNLTHYGTNWFVSGYFLIGPTWNKLYAFDETLSSRLTILNTNYPYGDTHVHASAADIIYTFGEKITSLGTVSTPAANNSNSTRQSWDCDPTGQYMMFEISVTMRKSSDYGATASVALTFPSLSYDGRAVGSPANYKVYNLGDSQKWLVTYTGTVYLDPISPALLNYLHIFYTSDFGVTWVDWAYNLHDCANGVCQTAVGAIRTA